jgi:hypothetical protein
MFTTFSIIMGVNNTYQLLEMEKRATHREKDMVNMHMKLMVKVYGTSLDNKGWKEMRILLESMKVHAGIKEGGKKEESRKKAQMQTTWLERVAELKSGVRGKRNGPKKGAVKNDSEIESMRKVRTEKGPRMEGIEDMRKLEASSECKNAGNPTDSQKKPKKETEDYKGPENRSATIDDVDQAQED